jgi:lipoate-protein ligase A
LERSAVRKFSGGKLLKVTVRSENGVIQEVRITGDFFVHPEDSVEEIERVLQGITVKSVRGVLKEKVEGSDITTIGFKLDDLISMIEGCVG